MKHMNGKVLMPTVSNFPLLIDDIETMPMGSFSCIIIIAYLICELKKKCNNKMTKDGMKMNGFFHDQVGK